MQLIAGARAILTTTRLTLVVVVFSLATVLFLFVSLDSRLSAHNTNQRQQQLAGGNKGHNDGVVNRETIKTTPRLWVWPPVPPDDDVPPPPSKWDVDKGPESVGVEPTPVALPVEEPIQPPVQPPVQPPIQPPTLPPIAPPLSPPIIPPPKLSPEEAEKLWAMHTTSAVHLTSHDNAHQMLDSWIQYPYLDRIGALLIHPKDLPPNAHTSKWEKMTWECDILGGPSNLTGSVIIGGHHHKMIVHCPLPKPVRPGERLLLTLREATFGSEFRNMSFLVPINDPQNVHNDVAICSSPLTNKGPFLAEWIEYHRMIGVKHFYIYDWDSNDNSWEIYRHYMELGIMTVTKWSFSRVWDRDNLHFQPAAQNHCLHKYGPHAKWLLYIDVDEFIMGKDVAMKPLGEIYDDIEQNYMLPNQTVIVQPAVFFVQSSTWKGRGIVMNEFTRRTDIAVAQKGKMAVLVGRPLTLSVHVPTNPEQSEYHPDPSILRFNHYFMAQRGPRPLPFNVIAQEIDDTTALQFVHSIRQRLIAEFGPSKDGWW